MTPMNLNPFMLASFAGMSSLNAALQDKEVTVEEAIDIVATAAKAAARAGGWADTVIATTKTDA